MTSSHAVQKQRKTNQKAKILGWTLGNICKRKKAWSKDWAERRLEKHWVDRATE